MKRAARRSVALIGLRCSGKTSVGRRLAELLALPFADLDVELAALAAEEAAGAGGDRSGAPADAGGWLALLGEPRFRVLEERALARILAAPAPLVLATGGGAIESARNRALLRERCRCVWLRAEPAVLRRRLAADPTPRPALTAHADAPAELDELARRRSPWYGALASLQVDANHASVETLAQLVASSLAVLE